MGFLGVTNSAKGFTWVERTADQASIDKLQQQHALEPLAAKLLAARGIEAEQVEGFLHPRLRTLLPDPSTLKGFDDFEAVFFKAIEAGEEIGILADYDVDGASSAAVLVALLRALGVRFHLYVPDRLTEGYGPSDQAFAHFARLGVRTIVCLDCGSMAHGPVQRAQAAGQSVLIIDHHLLDGAPPAVAAHINPNQDGCESGIGACAAVGVCFVVVVGLRRAAEARGLVFELDLIRLLDLVALGTVCDVVPLKGLNRAFVLQGLKVWPQTLNPGLQALTSLLRKAPKYDGSLAGFQIGPRLNAAGRIGPSDLAAKILTSEDVGEAQRLAAELDRLNQQRREIEAAVLAQARLDLAEKGEGEPFNLVANPSWHPGVVGIVAGRLKDATGKPSLVLGGHAGEPMLTGSGRSIPGFDLGAVILDLRARGVLASGGGHAMAAGLKLEPGAMDALADGLRAALENAPATQEMGKQREIDFAIRPAAASGDLARFLTAMQPYGSGNPEPKVAVTEAHVEFMQLVGKNHLRVTLSDATGEKLKGIAFRAAGSNLETVLRQGRDRPIHLAGSLTLDDWQGGDSAQLLIDDAALAV